MFARVRASVLTNALWYWSYRVESHVPRVGVAYWTTRSHFYRHFLQEPCQSFGGDRWVLYLFTFLLTSQNVVHLFENDASIAGRHKVLDKNFVNVCAQLNNTHAREKINDRPHCGN